MKIFGSTSKGGVNSVGIRIGSDDPIIQGCTFEGNLHGIQLYKALITHATVSECTVAGNLRHGIWADVGAFTFEGFRVHGCFIYNNDQSNGGYNGIMLDGASKTEVTNNCIYDDQGAEATQDLGIRINAGDSQLITENYFSGNVSGPVTLAGSPTNVVCRANRGYKTENDVLTLAFAIDAVAMVIVTIPHGLDVTPSTHGCQLTVAQDTAVDDWTYGFVKVTATDGTNVTAKVRVTVASATGGATAKIALRVVVV